MPAVKSLARTTWVRLTIVLSASAALIKLVFITAAGVAGRGGSVRSRVIARLSGPDVLRLLFEVLRAFVPNLALRRKLVTSYDNVGTVVVTRFDDVKDVLRRDQDFEVVYAPRMMRITDGQNFFLGMQDGALYSRDVSNMRLAVRSDDIETIVKPFALRRADELVGAASGRIDVPQQLTLRVPAQLLGHYFGAGGPSERELIEWTTLMFWYLFADLDADPELDERALKAASSCRSYLDNLIRERKQQLSPVDDVLGRCLLMQSQGRAGMSDLEIRNNLLGLMIGAVPTISKAAVQALDQLLERPEYLSSAQAAARSGNDTLLTACVFEALRFNPVNPLIFRRAAHDTTIAANKLRALDVKRGAMVLAANLSAMFDPMKIDLPKQFRIDRPWDNYMLWGDGLHACFGAQINLVLVPAILKPLLARRGLRRVARQSGRIDTAGTPFPVHMHLEFDIT
jgi:cytochrome P450